MKIDDEMRAALDRVVIERPEWFSDLQRDLYIRGGSHAFAVTAMEAVGPYVLAAEERGRRKALREAAQKIRGSDIGDCCDECKAAAWLAANLIDPDKETA